MSAPLQGMKVLDLSRVISGPYCGMLLGDMGADVIKVEKAGKGDDSRQYKPWINGESTYTFVMNRNKRDLELNFRSEEGKKLLHELIKKADVVIENFRPGTMDKMGCSWETIHKLNPKTIMVSISGYGSDGPLRDYPAFDAAIQAMSGIMSINGYGDGKPTVTGTYCVDYATAIYAAFCTCACYAQVQLTGQGQHIELSLLETASTLLVNGIPNQAKFGTVMKRQGSLDRNLAPGDCYECKDHNYVMMIAGTQPHFKNLCIAMGREDLIDDPRFKEQEERFKNQEEINGIVAEWFLTHDADEAQEILKANSLVSAKVETTADLLENPQLKYKNKLVRVKHPIMGEVTMMGTPYTMSDYTPDLTSKPAPYLGQHNEEVLQDWLGYDHQKVEELKRNKAISL